MAIAIYPRTYLSESKLVIRIGRESVGLDPTATTGETVMLQKTQDEEVNSAVNILTSREVLERVVEKIGADRIPDDSSSDASSDAATTDSTVRSVADWISDTLVSLRLSYPGTKWIGLSVAWKRGQTLRRRNCRSNQRELQGGFSSTCARRGGRIDGRISGRARTIESDGRLAEVLRRTSRDAA